MADFFLNLANEEFEKQVKGFDTEARKRLLAYTWSGNVRELKRVVRMAVLHTEGETVTADTLELDETTLLEKPRDFDPFGQTGFAHLWLQYD